MAVYKIECRLGTDRPLVLLPKQLFTVATSEGKGFVKMKYGQKKIQATAKASPNNNIIISKDIAEKLYLPPTIDLHVKATAGRVTLGPIVGIMTTAPPFKGNHFQFQIGKQRRLFFSRFMDIAAKRNMTLFLFTPNCIDWQKRAVFGLSYIPSGQGQWIRRWYPLPDAVWNRVPHRGAEVRADVLRTKQLFKTVTNVLVSPDDYFYKWEMHEVLSREGSITRHLPETIQYRGAESVLQMLRRYPEVFVKVCSGSHGHGVIKFEKPDNSVAYSYHLRNGRLRKGKVRSKGGLERFITNATQRKTCVVQQGLQLAHYEGRAFDLRATVQKNLRGEWHVVGLSAKIAGSKGITTHVCNGGKVVPGGWLLKRLYADGGAKLNDVNAFAIRVAEASERASGWNLGELGMDIAIDKKGHLWLFEVNTKPGRIVFAPEWAVKERYASYRMLVDYLQHLSGFGE